MAKKTEAEGIKYFGFSSSDLVSPSVDTEYILKLSRNAYIVDPVSSLKDATFIGQPTIKVKTEEGETDEDKTNWITKQTRQAKLNYNIQKTWSDDIFGGASVISPNIVKKDNEIKLTEIRNLSWASINSSPNYIDEYNIIMQGITINKITEEIEVYQSEDINGYNKTQIKNFRIIKDPTKPDPAGESSILPLVPIVSMLTHADKAETQKVNRVGSPSIFPKIEEGELTEEYQKYLKALTQKWGKDFSFILPPGVTLADPKIKESNSAKDRIDYLKKLINSYFNPTSFVSKDGQLIGGSDVGLMNIFYNSINTNLSWLEEAYEEILDEVLRLNGYTDLHAEIRYPRPSIDRSEQIVKEIEVAIEGKSILPNEIRDNLQNLKLKELDETEEELLKEHYKSAPQPFGNTQIDNVTGFSTDKANKIVTETISEMNEATDAYTKEQTKYLEEIYRVMYEELPEDKRQEE